MESPAGLSTGESCSDSRFGSVPRAIAWTASTLCSSGLVKRVEAPASLPRGLEAEPFDQPLAIEANAEVAQRRLQFFEGLAAPQPEELFFEGAEEASYAAIGLGRADTGVRRLHAEKAEFLLEVAAHGMRAVAVGDAQAGGGVRPESTDVFANGLA